MTDIIEINEEVLSGEDAVAPGEKRTNPDGTVTIGLVYPKVIKFTPKGGPETVLDLKELKIKRPTGKDIRLMSKPKDPMESAIVAFEQLTGHKSYVFDVLDGEDIEPLTEVVGSFMGKSR